MFKQVFLIFCFLFSMFCVANTFQAEANMKREKEMFDIVSKMKLSESVKSVVTESIKK